jgi:hypothetical protein
MRNSIIFSLAFCATLSGCTDKPRTPEAGELTTTNAWMDINVDSAIISSSTEFYKEFRSNEFSAKSKYGNKPFFLEGFVDGVEVAGIYKKAGSLVDLDKSPMAQVNLKVGNSYWTVWAITYDEGTISVLKPGDRITLLCGTIADIPLNSPAECHDASLMNWKNDSAKERIIGASIDVPSDVAVASTEPVMPTPAPETVPAAKSPSILAMEERWGYLNEECVGGPHELGDAVCNARDEAERALERRGVCWAYSDWRVPRAEYQFHPCSQPRPAGFEPDPIYTD